jgi:dihydrofolate reductase
MREPLALIVCRARNHVIGRGGRMPWHEPDDLRRFRALTMGHTLIMGRATFAGLGRMLPGRHIIVLSRTVSLHENDVKSARDLTSALDMARARDVMPFICGGAQVYQQALPLVTRVYLTELVDDAAGDTTFEMDETDEWRERECECRPRMRFRVLERS